MIPAKTEVTVSGQEITVKGPLGTLSKVAHKHIKAEVKDGAVILTPKTEDDSAQWGTVASHVKNMIAGVNKPYEKKLFLEGIGYKCDVTGSDLTMRLGFSHPVKVAIPKDLKVTSEKGLITISGINKDQVGMFAAELRALKKPEPYKGKGFRYDTEVIRRKEGKKTV